MNREHAVEPYRMDGRAIAERMRLAAQQPERGPIAFWAGVAEIRLLEYQALLERAWLLEPDEPGNDERKGKMP